MSVLNKDKELTVISIGYGRHLFDKHNKERLRMEACASETKSYHMVIFGAPKDGLLEQGDESGLSLHPIVSSLSIFKMWKAIVKVRQLISRAEGKVVVTAQDPFETGLIGWIATRFSKASLNIQEHGDVFGLNFWRQESILNRIRFYVGLFILKQADTIRVVSKRIIHSLAKRGIKVNNAKLLSVVTDPKPFASAEPDEKIRQMFPEGSFILINAGRFVLQKNIPLLLRAFKQAQKSSPNLRLLLIGTGPEERNIKNLVGTINSEEGEELVKILQWTDKLPEFMASCDAYVLSSNYEGWGRVLLEAKYARLPVITTDVGCAGEEILDGVHGSVVKVDDESALSEAVVNMASDKSQYEKFKQNLQSIAMPNVDSYETYAKEWVRALI